MHCALGCEWNPHAVTHSPRVLATNSCASPAAAGKSTTRDRAPPSGSSVVPPSTTLSRRRRPRPPWSLGRTAATRPSGSAGSYHPAASSSRSRSIRSTQPLRPRCRARPSLCGTPRHRALTGAGPPHCRQVVEHAGLGDSVKIEIGDLAEKFDRIATKYSLGPRACERGCRLGGASARCPGAVAGSFEAAGCVGRSRCEPLSSSGPDGGQAAIAAVRPGRARRFRGVPRP